MFHSVKLVREQKEEYMDHLFDVLYESVYKLFKFIYYSVMNEKEILKSFQKELARIPEWNQLKVESAYNEFLTASKCTYFSDLVKTIYVLSIKMVLLGIPAENRSKIKIKVPDSATFYHRLLIHIARDVWKRPYLFYHKVKSIEQQNHLYQFETIIRRKIRSVIRDTIPMELMVQQLSNSDILKEAEDEESSAEASEQSSEDDKSLSSDAEDEDTSDDKEDSSSLLSEASEHRSDAEASEESSDAEAEVEDVSDDKYSSDDEESKDEEVKHDKSDSEDAEESFGNKESLFVEAEDTSSPKEEEKESDLEADDVSSVKAKDTSSVKAKNVSLAEADDKLDSEERISDVSMNKIKEDSFESKEEDIPVILQDSLPQDESLVTSQDSSLVTLYEEPKKKLIHIQELMKHKKKHGSKSKDRFF